MLPMKKVFKMQDLECANCAAKMQDAIGKIDGVESVSVNFLTQRLTLEAPEERMEEILKKADKAIRKFEPDCRILR